jgi:amino acid transporter
MGNVARDLPRVIHWSLTIVVVMFLVANASYFIVLPKELVAHSNTVALVKPLRKRVFKSFTDGCFPQDFGKAIFGPVGGVIFALVVAISCFGALNSELGVNSQNVG